MGAATYFWAAPHVGCRNGADIVLRPLPLHLAADVPDSSCHAFLACLFESALELEAGPVQRHRLH